jgi:FtsP/CotA-like multicopper oxidase with cupredoxin domain
MTRLLDLLGPLLLLLCAPAAADHHDLEFVVEEWVVDFLRPTIALPKQRKAARQTPFEIPDQNRKSAILVNGQYPGPTVEVYENDTVSINVVNRMISEATSIHWHGIHPFETPWTDGTVGVSQAAIAPGENFTYTFRAWPAGTHYWHSHMDGMQSAKGLRGAFIVKERDVAKFPEYDEDKLVILADEWQNPDVCLKLEGASESFRPTNPAPATQMKHTLLLSNHFNLILTHSFILSSLLFPHDCNSFSTTTVLKNTCPLLFSLLSSLLSLLFGLFHLVTFSLSPLSVAGNDVCSDIDYASVNGQVAWGDLQVKDSKKWGSDLGRYPYPIIEVDPGKCYRMRFIMMASNAENYIVKIPGHEMTLITLDGVPVRPLQITSINMHIGERADVIICANQKPGYYPMELTYDYACSLTPGHFVPPGFHPVSACNFNAFLKYSGMRPWPLGPAVPTSPKGTGGGANPVPTQGVPFDLTNPGDWNKTSPIKNEPLPAEPDVSFTVALGLNGPLYKSPTDEPMRHGRWYMDIDGRRSSWEKPLTPALHTKNKCGTNNAPILDIPENATTVEIVLNNLSPTAHNIHLHGMLFQVVNIANFEWCNVNKTACFLMPKQLNPCPAKNRRWADNNHTGGLEDLYWGCAYDPVEDKKTQNLKAPLLKDSFQIWQRSWAVLRFQANFPGIWQFHCHMEQHIPLGMIMAVNVLPSKQPPIPKSVPTEGPCPVVGSDVWKAQEGDMSARLTVAGENARLQQRVKDLEAKLATESQAADRCIAEKKASVFV